MVASMFSEIDHLDLLINNAGISYVGLLQDMSPAEWDDVMSTNLNSCFYTAKYAIPLMLAQGYGRILNVSSIWGNVGASCEVAYSSAKASLIGFTKALAKEVGPSGVRVNCLCPGVIDTDMNKMHSEETLACLCDETPLMRIGNPTEVAETILFLASEKSAFITGQIFSVDGGMTV